MRDFVCSLITALLCVLLLMVGGCTEEPISTEPDPLSDTQPSPMNSIEGAETELGKSFTISLVSNPTTGYSWQAHFDPEYLELVNNDFVSNSNLIGAPGVESFELKAIKQGQTELRMIYKRSWEDQFAEKRVILVQITGAPEIMESNVGENFTMSLPP